ncbi:hypothetical protein LTR37_007149 [Vermiconidia calcicola]|uniref:Uncharacterized protein n=1 Tax=Vermiconidia calcicola TaxID=1690605 RepID=A0ACC3NG48_9PEZI|nr:hypothetical protein LTR37_007149 [Vermiconidia calcicola]
MYSRPPHWLKCERVRNLSDSQRFPPLTGHASMIERCSSPIKGQKSIAVFESLQGEILQLDSGTSPDDGKTWDNRQTVYIPTGVNNNAGAPQVVNVGGTLSISFMTDNDTQLHDWINGTGAKLITSRDGGSTWDNKLEVFTPQGSWPGMVALNESSLLYMPDKSGA